MQTTTEELINRAMRHDPEAFTTLMQMYMKNMYKVALAILMNDDDTADAIQDTILTCWEKMNSLKQVKYFQTWMTRILINHCYDIRRKAIHMIDLDECEEPAIEDHYNLEWKEALATLDEKYRMVMILFYGEGYHVDEIAYILKIPASTIRTRLQRGRERLTEYYQNDMSKRKD